MSLSLWQRTIKLRLRLSPELSRPIGDRALPKTLELLHDRATNNPDEQLRQWAGEQLKMQNIKSKIEEEEQLKM